MLIYDFFDDFRVPAYLECIFECILSSVISIEKSLRQSFFPTAHRDNLKRVNVHGECVSRLDLYANTSFKDSFLDHAQFRAYVSEEEVETCYSSKENLSKTSYVIFCDPLDGSSNLAINGGVGSILSIYRSNVEGSLDVKSFVSRDIVFSAYVLYGSSTLLVCTWGDGVHMFSYDMDREAFVLSKAHITLPKSYLYYSVNEGHFYKYSSLVQSTLSKLKQDPWNLSMRYAGALVLDFHRVLMSGGVFLYPAMEAKQEGKLRLMYEGIPLAFIIDQASGIATDGRISILDKVPVSIHERTPLYIGSKPLVSLFNEDTFSF